jgi:uncharacterized metal-binding protein
LKNKKLQLDVKIEKTDKGGTVMPQKKCNCTPKKRTLLKSKECACNPEETILLPCSGGSNCGQITNQAALNLDTQGIGTVFCLAGIGANLSAFTGKAKTAKKIVAIDGCQVACAKHIVENAGLKLTDWVCVTDEGIAKSHTFDLKQADVNAISQKIKTSLVK